MKVSEEEIPFTEDHISKIQDGKKISTLRKVKEENVYSVGEAYSLGEDEGFILIEDRHVVEFGREGVDPVDVGLEFAPGMPGLAGMEGFSSISDLIDWFDSRNYSLPGKFFLYQFEHYVEDPTEVRE